MLLWLFVKETLTRPSVLQPWLLWSIAASYSTESNYTCHTEFVVRKLDFNVLNISTLIYKLLEV